MLHDAVDAAAIRVPAGSGRGEHDPSQSQESRSCDRASPVAETQSPVLKMSSVACDASRVRGFGIATLSSM